MYDFRLVFSRLFRVTIHKRLIVPLTVSLIVVGGSTSHAVTSRAFTNSEIAIQKAYIAYYGRPADVEGLRYWSQRLDEEKNLDALIQAFGVSTEFQDRFGSLSNTELINNIYQQLFGRDPDVAGRDFYTGELDNGRMTLQSFALDVINGALNEDINIVNNRLEASNYLVTQLEELGLNAPELTTDSTVSIIKTVTKDALTVGSAKNQITTLLPAGSEIYGQIFAVTKTEDSNDGGCDADCSLREALLAADSNPGLDLVVLPPGKYILSLIDEFDSSELVIQDSVHIRGSGMDNTIVDGNGRARIFQNDPFKTGVNTHLLYLTIQNGSSTYGGGLVNYSGMSLTGVRVTGNVGNNGAGILNVGNLTMNFCEVTANKALAQADVIIGFGGGIWNDNGAQLTMNDSQVKQNSARYNGAGIYNAEAKLTVMRTIFSGNQAEGVGGALENYGDLSMEDITFVENQANDGGGLSNQNNGTAVIRKAIFSKNKAVGVDLGGGAALFNYKGAVSIYDSVFTENAAYGEGGGAIETNGNVMEIFNSKFSNNQAIWHDPQYLPSDTSPGFGGAILIIADTKVTIEDTTIENNTSGTSGGGIYSDLRTDVTLTNVTVDHNTAQRNYGGGIYTEGDLTLIDSAVTHNTSKEHAGGIGTGHGVLTLRNSRVSDNVSDNGGGLGNFNNGSVLLEQTEIKDNKALVGFGGGVLIDIGTTFDMDGGSITGNSAVYGGAISINQPDGTVILDGVTIDGNTAVSDGEFMVNFGIAKVQNSVINGSCTQHLPIENLGGNSGAGCF